MVDDPLNQQSEEDKRIQAEAEKEALLRKLSDECRFILTQCPEFMRMLDRGMNDAKDAALQSLEEFKYGMADRHTGAKIAIRDLIGDIKRMVEYKSRKKKG